MQEALRDAGLVNKQNMQGKKKLNNPYKNPRHVPNFPKIVLRSNGSLRKELLTTEAKNWSELLFNERNGVSATQLRNFYNEVRALQSRIEASSFDECEALIGLLKSKAAYAHARAKNNVKPGFEYLQSMIEQGVDLSTSLESFKDFALFFESVMGFFKGK